ncbi:MAG TPA: hypothetical protein VIH99_00335 [Bdellovibrionota bacterium]|jgi:hypothetical protein
MAADKKLKKPEKEDPEMVKRLELLRDMELFQMIKELKMLKDTKESRKKEGN